MGRLVQPGPWLSVAASTLLPQYCHTEEVGTGGVALG